ncbi:MULTISPECIES: MarR family winged helix-turn-helix transcriptional regulator [unclassified Pseudodesulfovibrio]|uniref:MarR family winged helix-turn-helix transcriptional regulator n=1 Tax=unclassified Pseudodesulfovibrio TaxID=2661612 RepID=UPI000FEBD137|nr:MULTISPECIES: MarR family winged helix-turn-helix transcriptional regulator [unclassified Pseudodesulfovibrio]MCJ2163347.1 MarR family winged helix-turn-helix transcriptional regulator [Pseudodesulfovibrio sp. S3-i]RWU06586.1 MarR family transcriptional regulator [Pseudodesulfovibrio sp. S3]
MKTFEEMTPVLRDLGRAMAKYALVERKAFDFGIGVELFPAEIHMITAVDMRDGAGVTELAEEFGITKGAVSQLVAKLVKKGFLVKESDPENGSRVVIRTTELGHAASENHIAFHRDHDRVFLKYVAQLDEASYEIVRTMSRQMNLWMDNYLK